jgi:hypothetical protein
LYGVPNQDSGLDGMRKLREEHAERWEIIQNQEKDIKKKKWATFCPGFNEIALFPSR